MNPTSPQTVDYLTRPENLECTLDILRHGEEVHARLLNGFWNSLLTALQETTPVTFTPAQARWSLYPGPGRMDEDVHACADPAIIPEPPGGQALRYRIQQRYSPGSFRLFCGLLWRETLTGNKALPPLDEVARIRTYHAEAGLNQGNRWFCGEINFYPETSRAEFFERLSREGDSLATSCAGRFWEYVGDTHALVEAANLALQRGAMRYKRTAPPGK